MLSFRVNASLTSDLIELKNKFSALFAEVSNYPDTLINEIHKYAKISMIGASTRIENAILTDSEIEWLDTVLSEDGKLTSFKKNKDVIEEKLSKDRERSIEEVAGCRDMLELIYQEGNKSIPLTESYIRGLHQQLMQYYSKAGPYIGKYKTQTNSVVETNKIDKSSRVVFQTADAGPITAAAMQDLIASYNEAYKIEQRSILLACEFTYRFLAIHPFQDGNGRLGRGIFLLILLHSKDQVISSLAPLIAIDRQIEQSKSEYYYVLNKCSNGKYKDDPQEYKVEYFVRYMIKILTKALDDVLVYKNKHDQYQLLSESAQLVLTAFKEYPEIRLTPKQIVEFTSLPQRTVTHSLSTLSNQNFIQRYGQGAGVRYQLVF